VKGEGPLEMEEFLPEEQIEKYFCFAGRVKKV
jgi:hypothetical protein